MSRWRSSFLVLLVTGISLAQTSDLLEPNVRRVGEKLACLCGGCKNSVGSCPMLGCHYATPKREQIAKMLAEGRSDQQIVDAQMRQEGLQALVTPPIEGFNSLMWVMPFVMIGVGLLAIWFFIKHMQAKRVAAGGPELHDEVLERYHDQIEKETSKLE
ncbi:MAG: cytochrome c-type biogenesis protein CcmH [Bryobacteraceae bacterium]